ncbi:MAG TPA: efflux RND transporter periplasmic adaptor subunit [Vicinamibacterales bacterium]
MSAKKLMIGGAMVAIAVALVVVNLYYQRNTDLEVTAETIQKRDLEAVVSASGKIQPKLSVDISANTMGQVTRVAVNEGDKVTKGQFLLQIDARTLQAAVQRSEAAVLGARSGLEAARVAVETAQANLDRSRRDFKRQQDLWKDELTTREALERAENDVKVRETELKARQQEVATREQQINQESANLETNRYELTKVRLESPIDGLVTRRNIDEGETVVVGTMNNQGTVLMTVADMSIIQAEVEVDETDVPTVSIGQLAKVTIDAVPDRTFKGHVAEIGNSPIQNTGTQGTTARQATNFKVVVVIDEPIPAGIRPGSSCTADITTAVRSKVLSVPIQSVTVRELVYDEAGKIVREPPTRRRRRPSSSDVVSAEELPQGQSRKETEGVFAFRAGKAEFVPVKVGIAGEKFFEVLSGLNQGDQVITGPYASVRQINDGDSVKLETPTRADRRP